MIFHDMTTNDVISKISSCIIPIQILFLWVMKIDFQS